MARTSFPEGQPRAWFRKACRGLLQSRDVQKFLGQNKLASTRFEDHGDGGRGKERYVSLGTSDALCKGAEPDALEGFWYGRLLIRTLFAVGPAEDVVEKLAQRVLGKFMSERGMSRVERAQLVRGATAALTLRRRPERNFRPQGDTMDDVCDAVMSYVATAIKHNAREWLQIQGLARGVRADPLDPEDPSQWEDRFLDRFDAARAGDEDIDSDSLSLSFLGMPAPSTAREWRKRALTETSVPTVEEVVRVRAARQPAMPPSSFSVAELARSLGCARTTLLAKVNDAEAAGMRFVRLPGKRGAIVILEEQVPRLRSMLGKPKKPYPRKRRAKRARYPKDAIVFGGDATMTATMQRHGRPPST